MKAYDPSFFAHQIVTNNSSGHTQWYPKNALKQPTMILKKPTSQISLVLFKLIKCKPNKVINYITVGNFHGYPRISEYIRLLRHKYKLEIKTIMIKFETQFGTKSEYASYKLISKTKFAIEVYEKIILK